jgi:YVTN family beta-propeller protein
MKLFSSRFSQAQARLVQASAFVVSGAMVAGCGAGYRPVISPINPSGPGSQPTSLVAVVSTPTPSSPGAATPGVATIIDYSGDTIMASAPIGPGPTSFTIDQTGSNGYTVNSDGTLTNFPISTNLQPKQVEYTTLPASTKVLNMFSPSAGLYASDLSSDSVDVLNNFPATFKLSIPVAATPLTVVGPSSIGQRVYVVSQGFADSTGVACNVSPRTASANGEVDGIETSSNTVSSHIPVGKCPVYAIQSPDSRRLFVLNRGDDTVTVIDSQNNTLDNRCPPPTGCTNQAGQTYFSHPSLPLSTSAGLSGTGVPTIAGPVYAEYNAKTSQLVVSNYDGNTVNVIDVSLDVYGNDSPTFGTTYTIPVGTNPASVTVLNDGSRAYTANQADSTVSVVDLSSHSLVKTLPVNGHPRTVASTQNSLYGKVYAASPDSPYLTIIRTDQDIIDATVLVQGNIVDVRVSTQDANKGNSNVVSRKPGFGQPCNLPPALVSNATLNGDPGACSRMP